MIGEIGKWGPNWLLSGGQNVNAGHLPARGTLEL